VGSIQVRKGLNGKERYRAQVRMVGSRSLSKTFETITKARQWIQRIEVQVRDGGAVISESKRHTLSELIDRYLLETLPHRKSHQGPLYTERRINFRFLRLRP
jgi:hypothetical protein